jgi:hypothetical protein
LGSGAVLQAAIGHYRGKGGDEQSLLRSILDTLARTLAAQLGAESELAWD